MFLTGSAICVAHGAGQVAVVGNFENSDTGMLFVIGAESAVEGAPTFRFDLGVFRKSSWEGRFIAVEPGAIAADEVFA
jgi:hypothetical protein